MLRRGFVDSFSESFYGLGLSRSFHGFGVCAVDYGQFVPLLFKFLFGVFGFGACEGYDFWCKGSTVVGPTLILGLSFSIYPSI